MEELVIETFCIWCDLLGYGEPFIKSNWNLYKSESMQNLIRIKSLADTFRNTNFFMAEKGLMLNDGIIRNLDLFPSNKHAYNYLFWFERTIMDFDHLNYIDKSNGFPGARAVLTFGHRYQYMDNETTAGYYMQATPDVKKEYDKNTILYSPKEFQMNTAFSKAYIMESYGSRIGLSGSNFYVDEAFLDAMKINLEREGHLWQKHTERNRDSRSVEIDIDWVPVKYFVDFIEEDRYFIWTVKRIFEEETIELFKLWLSSEVIEFNDKGIDTKLYRVIKLKPTDENDFIYIINDFG